MKQLFNNSKSPNSASPDRLDMPIRIKTFKSWLMWIIITCIFIAVILWSIVGNVYVRVGGQGIILPQPAEIFDAAAQGKGLLVSLKIKIGDKVKKGQIIAEINVKELHKQIDETKKYLSNLKQQKIQTIELINKQTKYLNDYTEKFNKALEVQKTNTDKYKSFMTKFVSSEKTIANEGAISMMTYERAIESLFKIDNTLFDIISKKASQKLNQERYRFEWTKEIFNLDLQILKTEEELVEQQLKLEEFKFIRSPINGVINQLLARPGTYLFPGTSVATVVTESKRDDVLGFFSPFNGKRIDNGMIAFISPSIAKKELYGTIESKVQGVSEYPLDIKTLTSVLKEPDLAKLFSKNGPPIMCKLSLERDTGTYTGFKWTSRNGPHFKITNGTICDISVVVQKRKPITLVIPFFRKLLGFSYDE